MAVRGSRIILTPSVGGPGYISRHFFPKKCLKHIFSLLWGLLRHFIFQIMEGGWIFLWSPAEGGWIFLAYGRGAGFILEME